MRCPYCSAENRDGSTFCIFCGHALPAPSARTPATPNYAFPHPGQTPNARMVGKGQFTLKSGIPLPSGMSGVAPQAPPANAATAAPDTVAPASDTATPAAETPAPASPASAEAEATWIAPDPMLGNGRRAPYFDPAAFDALAHPPNWREPGPARGSKAAHLILLLCMFGVGLLSGAAVLWWLNHPGEIQQALNDLRTDLGLQAQARVTAAQPTLSEKMPPPELTVTPPEAKVRAPAPAETPAISAGELPYDGQAPAAGSVSAPDNSVSAPALHSPRPRWRRQPPRRHRTRLPAKTPQRPRRPEKRSAPIRRRLWQAAPPRRSRRKRRKPSRSPKQAVRASPSRRKSGPPTPGVQCAAMRGSPAPRLHRRAARPWASVR